MVQEVLQEMEIYAKKKDIPIMEKEGIEFICAFIKSHNIKHILEIGSAIGYSAIRMAMVSTNVHVTTIERDHVRYEKAVSYVQRCGLSSRVTLLHEDALEACVHGSYELLFIDAAKAQYIRFFELYEQYIREGGFIVSDNLKFHGFVEHQERVTSRNLRQLVGKIARYVEYLKNRDDYDTKFYDFGDGVSISQKNALKK